MESELRALLARTPLAGVPVFPVAAAGAGFRLAVNRHFAVAGAGSVVTGTAYAGQRCALNLVGVAHREVERGDWLCVPAPASPT